MARPTRTARARACADGVGGAARNCLSDGLGDGMEQLGRHGNDAFAIGLGRRDDQQGDDFAVGALVVADAQVGQLQELLDGRPGVALVLVVSGGPGRRPAVWAVLSAVGIQVCCGGGGRVGR